MRISHCQVKRIFFFTLVYRKEERVAIKIKARKKKEILTSISHKSIHYIAGRFILFSKLKGKVLCFLNVIYTAYRRRGGMQRA